MRTAKRAAVRGILPLEHHVAGAGAALDGGDFEGADLEFVLEQLEQAQFLLAGVGVGGGHVAGQRVGGLVQPLGQAGDDLLQRLSSPFGSPRRSAQFAVVSGSRSSSNFLNTGSCLTMLPMVRNSASVMSLSAAETRTMV